MINTWFGAIIILSLSMVLYTFIGTLLEKVSHDEWNWNIRFLMGYVFCTVLFQILNIPFEFLNGKLSVLSICYVGVLLALCVGASLWLCIRKKKLLQKSDFRFSPLLLVFFVLVLIQVLFMWSNGALGSPWDSSTYNGYVASALWTDRLNRTDAYTGAEIGLSYAEAFISVDMHAATVCFLTKLHPLIYVGRVLGAIQIIAYNCILFEMAGLLFKKNETKQVITMILLFVLNMGLNTAYTQSRFMFFRAGEPKTLLACVGIPMIIYSSMIVIRQMDRWWNWWKLFIVICFALSLSQTGWLLIPVLVTAMLAFQIIRKRKYIIRYMICMVPTVVTLAFIFLWRV